MYLCSPTVSGWTTNLHWYVRQQFCLLLSLWPRQKMVWGRALHQSQGWVHGWSCPVPQILLSLGKKRPLQPLCLCLSGSVHPFPDWQIQNGQCYSFCANILSARLKDILVVSRKISRIGKSTFRLLSRWKSFEQKIWCFCVLHWKTQKTKQNTNWSLTHKTDNDSQYLDINLPQHFICCMLLLAIHHA